MKDKYRFTSLKYGQCKGCKMNKVLHEIGINIETKEKVKQCMFCKKTTVIGRRRKDGKANK